MALIEKDTVIKQTPNRLMGDKREVHFGTEYFRLTLEHFKMQVKIAAVDTKARD